MDNRPESASEVFEAVRGLHPAAREAFLDRVCSRNPELRRAVEDLLAQDAGTGSVLQHPDFSDNATNGAAALSETISIGSSNGTPATRQSTWSLERGQTLIDRFTIVRPIAKGGMGEVYEAADRFLQGVHVALKTILPHVASQPVLQRRFEREVLLAREVVHPNLCPIYDIFHCDEPSCSFLFLTMKLLPGETLAERLDKQTPISSEEGLAILKHAASGLAAIHGAGVIHRDIKPNNIMLDGNGADVRLWITDFGLARALESDTTLSGKGTVAGTPSYIAPELLAGHSPTQASDLYAFGVVMHEVFTGQKPAVAADRSSIVVNPRLNSSSVPSLCSQLVAGCLDLDPLRRHQAFEQALDSLGVKRRTRRPLTRRQFIAASGAGLCALGVGSWVERQTLYDLLHPLPRRRFVALLNWPKTSDSQVTPMLTGVLAAIKGALARIEAADHNLFVISPEDVDQDLTQAANLREVCDPLGANLVLAASGVPGGKHFDLLLRVFDPISGRALRSRRLTCDQHEITSLPAKAVRAAASLLSVSSYLQDPERTQPGTHSAAAFTAFQQAETLMKQPNDEGLDAAIAKYKEAVDLDPQYAIAHARLGIAFGHLYGLRRDPAALELARGNCERALMLEPNLVDGHLALALVFEQTGDERGALDEITKALKLDPSNPRALLWQGQIFGRLNHWADAEDSFKRVLQERPNSWVAYNEWGVVLNGLGKYQEAIEKFRAASLAAPGNSQALGNLGGAYLQIGDFTQATEALKKSLALQPNDLAAVNASLALRYQGKFAEALPFAQQAVQLNSTDDTNWLELGECYSSLGNHVSEAKSAYLRAAQETEKYLRTDPTNGPSWMRLALYQVKSGNQHDSLALIQKAESLGANDMDSQLFKARILELLGKRDEALATLAACFRKGATSLQFAPFPDMESLRRDPRYLAMMQSTQKN